MIKYSGASMLLLSLLIVAGTLYMASELKGDISKHPLVDSMANALMARISVGVDDKNALKHAHETLQRAMLVPENIVDATGVIDLPPVAQVAIVRQSKKIKKRKVRLHHYVVSMVYSSGKKNYAVIDGRFCTQGMRLRHGDRVIHIKAGSVLVSQGKTKRWFHVKNKP